jgi:hypothetical protein
MLRSASALRSYGVMKLANLGLFEAFDTLMLAGGGFYSG